MVGNLILIPVIEMKYHHSAPEALEARITPAAIYVDASSLLVSLTGGALSIAPKIADTSVNVSVAQLPDGSFLIADAGGDTDAEDTADFTGTVSSISVATGGGDDVIEAAFSGTSGFRGSFAVGTGLGNDSVTISEGLLRGALSVSAKGSAEIVLGGFGSGLYVKGSASIAQVGGAFSLGADAKVNALNAVGATDFELLGSVVGKAALKATTGASFALGGDPSSVSASVGGLLSVTGSGTADYTVNFSKIAVYDGLFVNLGNGTNEVTANAGTILSGNAVINTGSGVGLPIALKSVQAGEDTIHLTGFTAYDALTVNSGAGDNDIIIDGAANLHGRVKIIGGNAADAVVLSGMTGFAGLSVALGDGTNNLSIDATTVSGTVTLNGGAGDDTLAVKVLSARGDVVAALGGGVNRATFDGTSTSGSLKFTGGAGNDTLSLINSTVHGVLNATLFNGSNGVTIGDGTSVFGAAVLNGGTGDDTVTLGSALGAGPVFHGRTSVSLGAAATSNAFSALSGSFDAGLSFKGGAGADAVALSARLVIFGDLLLNMGEGANSAAIATFSNTNVFTYIGGAGIDTLTLDGKGGGHVVGTANLGDGNDVLSVGSDASSFFTSLVVDGSTGTNSSTVPASVVNDGIALAGF